MSMMSYTPIVECRYGWGQVLCLSQDGLRVEGVFYALSELERVYPTYHRVLGVSSARLELQFRKQCLIIPGIADVPLAQKIVEYITRWNAVTEAIEAETVRNACDQTTFKQLPEHENGSLLPTIHYFWEYDANDMPTTVEAIPTFPHTGLPARSSFQALQSALSVNPVPHGEPWPAMLYSERVHRLRRLEAERELRIYGYDVQALSQRFYDGPLPLVLAPLRLFAGETAHYSIEANLCIESISLSPRRKRRVKDRGKLVLTNKRFIYLGRKRQIILGYEKIVQISCLPGAVALDIEYVSQRQFFEMRRPLECSFYLKCLLEDAPQYSQEIISQAMLSLSRSPAVSSGKLYQKSYSRGEGETLKLSLDQLCLTPTADEDSDDTQKLVKLASKSL